MVFSVVIHQEESGLVGRCRELPEIVGAGETLEECCTNVREAFIAYLQAHGPTALESPARKTEGSHRGYGGYFSLN
ncbi:MAG: type II toxin-antitoxin system HicB family antitoxin [Candidatus Hydrogenedentes bacterium]|nr:type II toxin-antitoxin system HicB family antitoxin [Candidatus Hydrogenedentota bacterium]